MKIKVPIATREASVKGLVVRSRPDPRVFRFTPDAIRIRSNALAQAKKVGQVKNADQQLTAVSAQRIVALAIKHAKGIWEEAKRPLIDYRRKMDACAKEYLDPLEAEAERLARAVGDFQAVESARHRAALQANNDQLLKLERERAAELAKATSIEEMDSIHEKYDEQAKATAEAASQVAVPVRTEGQHVQPDWAYEVVDIWTLARAHPTCVKIEPRTAEIKALLNAGVTIAGIRAWREVKSRVRLDQPVEV